ncbi:MAG: LysR substrate-binding domain-containing protein [Sulfurimicrobium sp.]|nr:LysR substrate-binding domain-containing protein [Sulfurimicrobium sp.]
MTLTELRYIVSLARTRHFGRAAEACFVSQPTLSVAIRKLEEELGVALFERGTSEIAMTPIGEQVVAQAQRVLEEASTVKIIAQQGQDQLAGPLRLGAIYTIAPYLLPKLIPALHQLAPDMPLHIDENFTARLNERLKQGDLDVIIIALPFDEPGFVTQALYDEPFQVALPASHSWCERKTISSAELEQESLLLLGQGHCFRDQVLQACPALNRSSAAPGSLQKTLEGSSLETIRHMVASGAGITVLPCSAVGTAPTENSLLAFRPFCEPIPSRRVALAWRRRFPRPDAIAVVRQAVLNADLSCVSKLDLPPEEN